MLSHVLGRGVPEIFSMLLATFLLVVGVCTPMPRCWRKVSGLYFFRKDTVDAPAEWTDVVTRLVPKSGAPTLAYALQHSPLVAYPLLMQRVPAFRVYYATGFEKQQPVDGVGLFFPNLCQTLSGQLLLLFVGWCCRLKSELQGQGGEVLFILSQTPTFSFECDGMQGKS